jgi:hypothetical protein
MASPTDLRATRPATISDLTPDRLRANRGTPRGRAPLRQLLEDSASAAPSSSTRLGA